MQHTKQPTFQTTPSSGISAGCTTTGGFTWKRFEQLEQLMNQDLELKTNNSVTKSQTEPLRVVYIAGVGRSGSTVLDSVLGNHPLIQSVGELSRLANDAWIHNFYCSCGKRSQECPFWVAVYDAWCASNGDVSAEQYVETQKSVERFRRLPVLLREQWKNSETFQMYAEQTLLILKAIQKVSGRSIIVDSSKGVERAYVLSLIPEIDLRVIQLVRDPRGVVWSHKKAFKKDIENGLPRDIQSQPAWRAALYWCRINMEANWLRQRLGPEKALLIRYEDFMTDTLPVLQNIGDFIGLDLTDIQRMVNEGEKLYFDHTIAGNRVRMKGKLELKFDQEWRHNLSPNDRRVTELLSGWLMNHYGYKR